MGYNRAVKTDAGNELLSRVIAGETTITFTKIATSEKSISEFEIKQEMSASATKFERESKVGVILDTVFSNVTLTTGYDINVIGIYAKDSNNNEIMFSYLENDGTPKYLEAYNGSVPQNVHIQVEAGIWLDDDSLIVIDQSGIATIGYVNEKIKELTDKLNNVTTVTIPIDGWISEIDSDNNTYYTREIDVAGMTAAYVGIRDMKPVYPRPFNLTQKEEIDELFALILDGDSLDGKIKLYASEIPTSSFQIYLYGV